LLASYTETVPHIFSCPSEEASQFCSEQRAALKDKIIRIGTPEDVTSAITHDIEHWEISMNDPSYSQKAPTAGSVLPTVILITQAYSDQTRIVSWDNFLRGRIIVFCGKAYLHHKQVKQKCITSSSSWTLSLIKLLLEYSFSLWEFRNGVLHGLTVEETAERVQYYCYPNSFGLSAV
jgi:hypothetical protein